MGKKRRKSSGAEKAKIVLEALKERQTSELSKSLETTFCIEAPKTLIADPCGRLTFST